MNIHFVLIEPAVPENIGAAARALKTMGFHSLRLINSSAHLSEKAEWLAHGAKDILNSAIAYQNFKDAIADLDLVIGTTSRKRSVKYDYYTPESIREILISKENSIDQVGIVFGKEESGMSNEMLNDCDLLSTIPMVNQYPSLNLGQCVMLYAYVLSGLSRVEKMNEKPMAAEAKNTTLKQETRGILYDLDIHKNNNLYNRLMERVMKAGDVDVNLMLSFAKYWRKRFENSKK